MRGARRDLEQRLEHFRDDGILRVLRWNAVRAQIIGKDLVEDRISGLREAHLTEERR